MPRNPNLVPTVITDINGVTKTVHRKQVRPSKAVKANALKPPVPAATVSSREERIQQTLNLIEKANGGFEGNQQHYATEALHRVYQESYFAELNEYLTSDPVIAKGVAQQVIEGERAYTINETVHFYRLMDIKEYGEVRSLAQMLNQYQDLIRLGDRSKNDDPQVQAKCIAIMKATSIIAAKCTIPKRSSGHPLEVYVNTGSQWDSLVISDYNLVDLIMERPQDAEQIAEVVVKHNTTNPNEILGIMDGILPALAEGNL